MPLLLVTSPCGFTTLASVPLRMARRISGDTLLKTMLSAMPSTVWALGVWLLWELLLLRQCGKIRLRKSPRNHLLHLFQLGQTS